jgi:hypothetical protein
MKLSSAFYDNIKFVIQLFGIYFIWIFLHYISAHLYVYFCNKLSIVGFIFSPFLVPALHCQALRWVISNGAININAMWMTLGTWIVTKLVIK